ncbi:hypothetical protein H6G35_20880 [Aulosira sp. FACHB-113]|nr:hypothetical protein [Aulosira sp. FACHB-113]
MVESLASGTPHTAGCSVFLVSVHLELNPALVESLFYFTLKTCLMSHFPSGLSKVAIA